MSSCSRLSWAPYLTTKGSFYPYLSTLQEPSLSHIAFHLQKMDTNCLISWVFHYRIPCFPGKQADYPPTVSACWRFPCFFHSSFNAFASCNLRKCILPFLSASLQQASSSMALTCSVLRKLLPEMMLPPAVGWFWRTWICSYYIFSTSSDAKMHWNALYMPFHSQEQKPGNSSVSQGLPISYCDHPYVSNGLQG